MFNRPQLTTLVKRLQEPRRFLQILSGPRQVGKTTLARQALSRFQGVSHYASADLPSAPDAHWLQQQWVIARQMSKTQPCVLVLDEVQKVPRWSEVIKMLWDEDSFAQGRPHPLRVILLGSSQFLVQAVSSESLAGRYELIRLPHWSYSEMREAFGWSLEQFIFFGGYPGAAALIVDEDRWRAYVLDAIIEPTLTKDVLQLARIDKPALLRRLFTLGCHYSGQILSYQKMIGQLQDAGNTTTLANYLNLLARAWMLTGLDKYAGDQARQRGSSPKLQALDTAFVSAQSGIKWQDAMQDHAWWGRLVESAVGAHLHNSRSSGMEVQYWRERNHEVDFVLTQGARMAVIEVKTGAAKGALSGLKKFTEQFREAKPFVVGTGGIPLEQFLMTPADHWLS